MPVLSYPTPTSARSVLKLYFGQTSASVRGYFEHRREAPAYLDWIVLGYYESNGKKFVDLVVPVKKGESNIRIETREVLSMRDQMFRFQDSLESVAMPRSKRREVPFERSALAPLKKPFLE